MLMMMIDAFLQWWTTGKYYLEDLHGKIPIDFSSAEVVAGFYTENCIVLAEVMTPKTRNSSSPYWWSSSGRDDRESKGWKRVIQGHHAWIPSFGVQRCLYEDVPSNERSTHLVSIRCVWTSSSSYLHWKGFSYRLSMCVCSYSWLILSTQQLQRGDFQESYESAMVVALSEIWMDCPIVVAKLRTLFELLEEERTIPIAFVLMGNFTSPSSATHQRDPLFASSSATMSGS